MIVSISDVNVKLKDLYFKYMELVEATPLRDIHTDKLCAVTLVDSYEQFADELKNVIQAIEGNE
jgi:hypothetical protein